jgi:hypothetical protein
MFAIYDCMSMFIDIGMTQIDWTGVLTTAATYTTIFSV